jgi:hypothetical protein
VSGLAPEVWGSPTPAASPDGPALCFDGDDALVVPANPLEGRGAFTLEVLARVDAVTDGAFAEPRFVHVEGAGGRATVEARVTPRGWYLDTFLRSGAGERALIDPSRLHPLGRWSWAAVSYDGARMRDFVDGAEEGSAALAFAPLGPGRTSLGARQNRVHWFQGCIRELRVTPRALAPAELARVR